MINEKLAQKMDVDCNTQFTIDHLQEKLQSICKNPEFYFSSPFETARMIEFCEYTLQMLWGFTPSSDYHSLWYKVSGCTCPKLDNDDRIGVGEKIISGDCTFHALNLNYWPK